MEEKPESGWIGGARTYLYSSFLLISFFWLMILLGQYVRTGQIWIGISRCSLMIRWSFLPRGMNFC